MWDIHFLYSAAASLTQHPPKVLLSQWFSFSLPVGYSAGEKLFLNWVDIRDCLNYESATPPENKHGTLNMRFLLNQNHSKSFQPGSMLIFRFFLLSLKYCRWQKSQTTTWIHLAYIKTCESWHKLPTPTGHCRISGPSTVSSGFSAILFRVTKAKRTAIEASLLNLSFQTTKEQWKKGPNGCFFGYIYIGDENLPSGTWGLFHKLPWGSL